MTDFNMTPETRTPDRRRLWATALASPEGRILVAGIVLTLLGLVIMLLTAIWDGAMSRMMGALALSNITVGRAVSMSIGYAAGYGHVLVLSVNMVTETILVLLFYPLFVLSMTRLIKFDSIRTLIDRTHRAALQRQDTIRKYGIAGLFIFVWFPFWMTGPVVGSAIGYLLKFPAWLTMVTVLAGTYVAMVAWGLLLFDIQKRAAVWGEWAPLAIVALLVAVLVGGFLMHQRRDH
jgi:uncharacterized membrane protein